MNNYSYILCRYNSNNLLETKVLSFLEIDNVYEYLKSQFNFLDEDRFQQNYINYVNNDITIILTNHIFSFESDNYLYNLYIIDKNSSYALLTFNEENLIKTVETFNSHDNALNQMKINYYNTFNDDNITTTSDILMIPNNGSVFGMIFKCNNTVG
jgi:hypothetical protein